MPKKAAKPEPKKTSTSAKSADTKPAKGSDYGAKDIFVLEGLAPVRKRPGMYIGGTGVDGLHHLVWEVADNAIDEAMAGRAKTIVIKLLPDGYVSVSDDGAGIPVEMHPQTKKSTLETVLTILHAGGKFGGSGYKVSGGLHGVGVSVVNALSEHLIAEVERDGGKFIQEFSRGNPKGKMKRVGSSNRTGTTITFKADHEIFSTLDFNDKKILERLRQQAYLTRSVHIVYVDAREEKTPIAHGFYFDGGLLSFVKHLAHGKESLQNDIFHVRREQQKMEVEVAFLYVDAYDTREMSFANNINTGDGGTHLTGFKSALTRSLNQYARSEGYLKEKDENLTSDDTREGLVAVVSVKLPEPQFEGQTKARLGTPEARTAVESVVNEGLKEFMEKRPSDARAMIEKVLLAAKARKAAKAAKDTVLRKGVLDGLTLPGKLADCSSKIAAESELYIVEGDSAGGTAKAGRDRRTQAILPVKGKILNVERARLDKMLANVEIRSLVVALGTAIAGDFDLSKLRYHKIVLMSDADVDGAHIRTLFLTLFFRYFRTIIDGGFLYIAQPPLFRVEQGKEVHYAYDEPAKNRLVTELQKKKAAKDAAKPASKKTGAKATGSDVEEVVGEEGAAEGSEGGENIKGIKISRYKGLGEMNADQLWDTTMNPENRILKQVTIDDGEEAARLFDVLMGDDVEPRKVFIQTQALSVKNLDI